MIKALLEKQKALIDSFYSALDVEKGNVILEAILNLAGTCFFTGVGKSGFVAQKIASTMMSTGTKAFFLPPIDALHGDLGMVGKEDIVLLLSKSGETEELLQLLPALRSKRAKTIALVSNPTSRLALGCDLFLHLPCEKELCPFDLAPTISTEIQLLFGDVLAVALMEEKGVNLELYAHNHPAGSLGRKLTLKVHDFMLAPEETPFCFPEDSLEKVISDFSNKRCGCLIVIDEKRQLKGIFTDGDLRRALQAKGEQVLKQQIGNLMTRSPKSIDQDSLAWEAMKLMEADQKHPIMVLPVLNEEKQEVVGIVKMHDLLQAGLD